MTAVLGIPAAWQLDPQSLRLAFGIEMLSPWFDLGPTGIASGRGSNYIHDLWGYLQHKF